MIAIENITKIFQSKPPVDALKNVSLKIDRGAFVAVTGKSGSGKSTLLNIVGALMKPDSGKVSVDGIDITKADEKKRAAFRNKNIGFVFQSFHVPSDLTAIENVILPARFSPISVPDALARARVCLERVGLGDRADSKCFTLSGGQLQRVAIARAIMMNPALLLADEPTGNLDVETGDEILKLFKELRAKDNLTIVVVTHEQTVAREADFVYKIKNGELDKGGPL